MYVTNLVLFTTLALSVRYFLPLITCKRLQFLEQITIAMQAFDENRPDISREFYSDRYCYYMLSEVFSVSFSELIACPIRCSILQIF